MAQTQRIGTHATTVSNSDGFYRCTYHSTDVVKWNEKQIILDSGGWRTNTTKARMNQCSNQFGLGFNVFQDKGNWFVTLNGKTINFVDNLVISRK
jgi:hypothetical protein